MEVIVPTQREQGVIDEFQQRRKRMLHSFGFCILLIIFALLILQLIDDRPVFIGISQAAWKSLCAVQLILGIILAIRGYWQYRCPVCGEIVKGHDKFYFGVLTDPGHCPNCRSRLRE